jgi:DNA-binding XRE family transcriptional regulator
MEFQCEIERKKRGLTQEKLAKQAGVSRGIVVSMEKGEIKPLHTVQKVYATLGLQPYLYYAEMLESKSKDKDKFAIGLLMIKQSL